MPQSDVLVHARLLAQPHGQEHTPLCIQFLACEGKGLDDADVFRAKSVCFRDALEFLANLLPLLRGIEGDGAEFVVEADGEALAQRSRYAEGMVTRPFGSMLCA